MVPVGLIIALASSAASAAHSIKVAKEQAQKANAMNTVRPNYNIPQSILEEEQNVRNAYNGSGLPGQGYMENKLHGNTSSAIHSISEKGVPTDTLAAISSINTNENNATNELDYKGVEYHDKMRDELGNVLGQKASYLDKAWEWNNQKLFQENAAAKSALLEASGKNMEYGIKGLANVGATMGGQAMGGGGSGAPSAASRTIPQGAVPAQSNVDPTLNTPMPNSANATPVTGVPANPYLWNYKYASE